MRVAAGNTAVMPMASEMQQFDEIELKLRVPDDRAATAFLDQIRTHVEVGPVQAILLSDTYWETPGCALLKAGLGARVRSRDQALRLELKPILLLASDVLVRTEVGRDLDRGTADDEIGSTLQGWLRQTYLIPCPAVPTPLLGFETVRRKAVLTHPLFSAEFCDDRVTARRLDGRAVPPAAFREFEIEFSSGDADAFRAFAENLLAATALIPSRSGKYTHARALLGFAPFRISPARPDLQAAATPTAAVHRLIAHQLARMEAYRDGTSVGLDPEHLHRLRVAIRRLRCALRVFRQLLQGKPARRLGRALKVLGQRLGRARDLDVHMANTIRDRMLLGAAAADGLLAKLRVQRAAEQAAVQDAIWGQPFGDVVAAAGERMLAVVAGAAFTDFPAMAHAVAAAEATRFAARVAPGPGKITSERLHRVRIAGKRLRYALEYLQDMGSPHDAAIRRLKVVQDVLGQFQDDVALVAQHADSPDAPAWLDKVAARIASPERTLGDLLATLDVPRLCADLVPGR